MLFRSLNLHEPLADGLDVADARKFFLQRRDQSERRRGLAVVLARGGDEDAGSGSVHDN